MFLLSSVEPVGSWFIPGTGTLCSPAGPHSQFGSPISLSPSHGCERYSSLRNHRSTPYTSPYSHRTNSPSEFLASHFVTMHPNNGNTSSPHTINKKLKQMLLRGECFTFLCLLCERSHSAVNCLASDSGCIRWNFNYQMDAGVAIESCNTHRGKQPELKAFIPTVFVCLAAGYSENSSPCMPMITSHDNWSGLQMPSHSSMMPMAHNSTSGSNSRFVSLIKFVFFLPCFHEPIQKT